MVYIIGAVCVALLVAADKFTKYLAHEYLFLNSLRERIIIDGVFSLYYHTNDGAGFGILSGRWLLLSAVSVVIMAGLVYYYVILPSHVKDGRIRVFVRASIILIVGGAMGNFIDRVRPPHQVIDFFYFSLIDFPIFNVADVFIVCGAVALNVILIFFVKDEKKEAADNV
jgi:signal peptidase II